MRLIFAKIIVIGLPKNKRRIFYLIRFTESRNLGINPHKTPFLILSLFWLLVSSKSINFRCIRFCDLWVIKDFANCRGQTISYFKRGIMFNYVKRHLYLCVDYLDLKVKVNFFYLYQSRLIHALSQSKQISFV